MILALDIGNTNVVLGCIADGEILFTERMATDSGKTELDYAISPENGAGAAGNQGK